MKVNKLKKTERSAYKDRIRKLKKTIRSIFEELDKCVQGCDIDYSDYLEIKKRFLPNETNKKQ